MKNITQYHKFTHQNHHSENIKRISEVVMVKHHITASTARYFSDKSVFWNISDLMK